MKKNLVKKILASSLVALLILGATACGPKEGPEKPSEPSDPVKSDPSEPTDTDPEEDVSGEIAEIKWVAVGGAQPENLDSWKEQVDPILEKKANAHINPEIVPWGEWNNRRNVIVNTGEPVDILFTDQGEYLNQIKLGFFAELTDKLEEVVPDLVEFVPDNIWQGAKVQNKIYAVPTYKDSSMTQYLVWNLDVADEAGVDIHSVKEWKDLTEPLEKIYEVTKDTETKGAGLGVGSNGVYQMFAEYDNMGVSDVIGVRYDDPEAKVVNLFETEEMRERVKLLREWYEAGYIPAGAATDTDSNIKYPVQIAQGWPSAAQTVWGPGNNWDRCEATPICPTTLSSVTVCGSLNGIWINSKHIDEALKVLETVNLDSKVRDLFFYGEEGVNFEYEGDFVKKNKDESWGMAGYTQGTFFTATPEEEGAEGWKEVQELNEKAEPSVVLGFLADTEPILDQLTNVTDVLERYKAELMTGTVDPDDPERGIDAMNEEMNKAGLQDVIEEVQKQVDEFIANKK